MNWEKLFYDKILVLAKLCSFELDQMIIETLDKHLAPYGYQRVCIALDKIIVTRRSREPFPAIRDIVELICPPLDDESEATEAVALLIKSVSRHGWPNGKLAEAEMGELAWAVVERFGGWRRVCETLNSSNVGQLQAQFKNIAKSIQVRARAGKQNEAPVIPISVARESGKLEMSSAKEVLAGLIQKRES
jgi:hypothetical protein